MPRIVCDIHLDTKFIIKIELIEENLEISGFFELLWREIKGKVFCVQISRVWRAWNNIVIKQAQKTFPVNSKSQ